MAIYIATESHDEADHDKKVEEVESFHSPLKDVTLYSSCFTGGPHKSFAIIHAHSEEEAKTAVPEGFKGDIVEVEEMDRGPAES